MAFKLQTEEGKWQQILRVIDASESRRGVKITKKDLEEMVENFNANVLNLKPNELQFNYSHESYSIAAGWITELRIKGKHLEAKTRWTPKGGQVIADEELRFISAEIAPNWQNVETQEVYRNVLLGAALTNIPFVPGMKPVALSDIDPTDDGIFIFTNNSEMNLFKQLLAALQGNKEVSLVEANILKSMFDNLEKEDQTKEAAAEVEAVEKTAEENAAKEEEVAKEATKKEEDLSKENADLKVQLSAKAGNNTEVSKLAADLKESQTLSKALQSQMDKLSLERRTEVVTAQVEKLAEEGKILAKDSAETVAMALAQGSEENQAKFLEYLEGMPVKVDFSEIGSIASEAKTAEAQIAQINKLAQEAHLADKSKTLAEHIAHFTRELS